MAQAYTQQRPTPDVVIGGSTNEGAGTSAQTFMDMMVLRAVQDFSLDMSITK